MQVELVKTEQPVDLIVDAIEDDPKLKRSTVDQYTRAVRNAVKAGVDLTDAEALRRYAGTVSNSTRAYLAAAIGKVVDRQERLMNASADPFAADVVRLEAQMSQVSRKYQNLRGAVPVEAAGRSVGHTWLSQREVKELMQSCAVRRSGNSEASIVTLRDRVAVGLLVAAGLRRAEAVALRFSDVITKPVSERERTVLVIRHGKGDKDREVPISDQLAALIERWGVVVGAEGRILRSLGRDKIPGDSLSTTAVYNIVKKRGALIGKPNLQPHDLRRTFAQLGMEAGVPLTQISVLLGHDSVETTRRYLDLHLDLDVTVSDFVAL